LVSDKGYGILPLALGNKKRPVEHQLDEQKDKGGAERNQIAHFVDRVGSHCYLAKNANKHGVRYQQHHAVDGKLIKHVQGRQHHHQDRLYGGIGMLKQIVIGVRQ